MLVESFNIIDCILLGILAVAFIAQVYWYGRYMAAPARKIRRDRKKPTPGTSIEGEEESLAPVSVILCAHNEAYNLSQYLQALLTQDYPEYEVIVVDDGSEDETRAEIERYLVHDPRLHMTFVPYGARVGSTKKLALTLAAKAAQYDYLLLTDADCVPESRFWIREMMKGFAEGQGTKDIVLGFSPYFAEKGYVNSLVRYDTLFNGLHYLGAAICGHPYMGVGRNLAYRKSLFFESGGFTKLMNNVAGDDDLFVNHVATKTNTAVVLSRESYTWSISKKTMKNWLQQKRRHLSVSPAYKESTKFRLSLEPFIRGVFYAAVIAMIALYAPSAISRLSLSMSLTEAVPAILCGAAILLFLIRWIVQTAVLNTSARRMGMKRFNMFSILWFDITLPLVSAWMLAVPKRKGAKW